MKIPFYQEDREDRDTAVPVTQCNELCIVTLATDYWAASHSFVEPGHSCFHSKFEKIVSVSEFLAARMQWGRKEAGMETVGPPSNSKCDSVKG